MSSLRPLAEGVPRDVLFYRPCARCQVPFWYCHSREPGRLYCGTECSTGARKESARRARKKYRASPEGGEQHRDEEDERRERRKLERVGDRRSEAEEGQLQRVATAAPYARAVEEKRDEPGRDEGERMEWILVAWAGMLSAAELLLGTQVECPWCGRSGTVIRVVSLEEWRREAEP